MGTGIGCVPPMTSRLDGFPMKMVPTNVKYWYVSAALFASLIYMTDLFSRLRTIQWLSRTFLTLRGTPHPIYGLNILQRTCGRCEFVP